MHEIRTLSNGIRVVAERIDYLKSVSIGVWVGNGSRYETAAQNGISHFIEHMLFKGTNKRSAKDIANEIENIGGQMNAFTAREYTCFYTKTLDAHAELAADILSDMLFNSALNESDMNLERKVIYEEIGMYEDSPEDLVYDVSSLAVWGDTPMGRPILGTKSTLEKITPEIMRDYIKTHYTSKNIVLSVSGHYDEGLFDILEKYFGTAKLSDTEPQKASALYTPRTLVRSKDIEQVQLVVTFKGIDIMDEDVYSLLVFNNIFGSGMSSRLFQNIREKSGLAYSICAGHSAYTDAGAFDIAVGLNPANLEKTAELIRKEIIRAKSEKLSSNEVQTGIEQLKGSYILGCESTGARMQAAGRSLLINKKICTQEETLEKIDAVTVESVAEIIDRILDTKTVSAAAVGPVNDLSGLFDFT